MDHRPFTVDHGGWSIDFWKERKSSQNEEKTSKKIKNFMEFGKEKVHKFKKKVQDLEKFIIWKNMERMNINLQDFKNS